MRSVTGFTLIELMIVVSIIGILAAVALPAYQDYTLRAKIVEGITLVAEIKPKIVEYYRARDRFPANNEQAGAPEPEFIIGNYVKQARVEAGAIHVELGNKIGGMLDGKVLTLRPIVVTGSPESPISWICGNDGPPEGMEAIGENRTTIEDRFLPAACRRQF